MSSFIYFQNAKKKGKDHRYLRKSRLIKFCYVPTTSAASSNAFLHWPLTVLTRQAVCTINQSTFLRCLWEGRIILFYSLYLGSTYSCQKLTCFAKLLFQFAVVSYMRWFHFVGSKVIWLSLKTGTLTEGGGSVQLTFSLRQVVL